MEAASLKVFVDEFGQPNLDVSKADVGTHFVLVAILVNATEIAAARSAVEAVRAKQFQSGEMRAKRLAKNLDRYRAVLGELNDIPFKFYAIAVDKREIRVESGLAFKDYFYNFMNGLLYRRLFNTFPNRKWSQTRLAVTSSWSVLPTTCTAIIERHYLIAHASRSKTAPVNH